MDSYTAHLMKCLRHIHRVIKMANDILSSISQPSVCSEVLLSSRGTDYIQGLLEVYRVSKRIEGGMTTLNISTEELYLILRDIELSWNNLQAFLSVCPCVLQRLLLAESTDSMLMYESHLYHPSCANFWLHFVDSTSFVLSQELSSVLKT
ncbi:LOW QUALITY PROTEIN: synergin gamma-like [Rhinophrynus dorsalis]